MNFIDDAVKFASMDNDTARKYIIMFEEEAEKMLNAGEISEGDTQDIFFGLLHECDKRRLQNDRRRMLAHIDTEHYNPFRSKNAGIWFIAQLRARGMGLIKAERN